MGTWGHMTRCIMLPMQAEAQVLTMTSCRTLDLNVSKPSRRNRAHRFLAGFSATSPWFGRDNKPKKPNNIQQLQFTADIYYFLKYFFIHYIVYVNDSQTEDFTKKMVKFRWHCGRSSLKISDQCCPGWVNRMIPPIEVPEVSVLAQPQMEVDITSFPRQPLEAGWF